MNKINGKYKITNDLRRDGLVSLRQKQISMIPN